MAEDTRNPGGTATIARRGGGSPGKATGGGEPPSPGKDHAKPPAESGRAVRNGKNLFALPVTRLKLGYWQQMPDELARFRLWVPTNTGGVLTIRYKDGKVDLRRPFKKVLRPAASEITYEVKPGEYGEYFAIASGKAKEWVQCTFVQTAFSRDGKKDSDAPLIPWDFYYWPTSSSPQNHFFKDSGDVLARYARAFGHDAEACRKAEEADHATTAVEKAPFYDWQGHCHMAAPASALFEEPKAVTYNNVSFSEEEMKLLAAEYWGNFGRFEDMVWELKRGPSKPGGSSGRWYLPGYFKPGDAMKGKETFVKGLMQEFRRDEPDPNLPRAAEQTADNYIGALGGPDQFRQKMDEWMGELAAEFYQALIDYMLVEKQPLMANMRSYRENGGPDQVWNQVYFWYQAYYREHSPTERGGIPDVKGEPEDQNDMIVLCEMRANLDHWTNGNPSGLPAEITGNQVKPINGNSLVFHNKWRIQFDGSGKIKVQDPRNGWHYLINDAGKNLFAPSELLPLGTPLPERKAGGPFSIGNEFVTVQVVYFGWGRRDGAG